MKDYIVLDLETPNHYNNSISSIGIVIVEEGEVVDKIYSLINPESHFESFNIALTGIHPDDVANSPTFSDYWNEIEDLVCSNIIVGQNITFDLGVISKSLTNYRIPLPSFKYYCTLKSCKQNLNLPDNSLSYIVHNVLNKDYDAHNAMADALMTNELYNYLEKYDNKRREHIKTYSYKPRYKRDFNRILDLNINYLYGLIQRFNYTDKVNDNHFNLIKQWYINNKKHNKHNYFNNILLKLEHLMDMNHVSKYDMDGLLDTVTLIQRSPVYKTPLLKLQAFKGIIDSILCYDTITPEDMEFINNWVINKPINDKVFKNFYKNRSKDSKVFKNQMSEFSNFLEGYIKNN